eukprot:5878971-Prymnesium_polylepis.1
MHGRVRGVGGCAHAGCMAVFRTAPPVVPSSGPRSRRRARRDSTVVNMPPSSPARSFPPFPTASTAIPAATACRLWPRRG